MASLALHFLRVCSGKGALLQLIRVSALEAMAFMCQRFRMRHLLYAGTIRYQFLFQGTTAPESSGIVLYARATCYVVSGTSSFTPKELFAPMLSGTASRALVFGRLTNTLKFIVIRSWCQLSQRSSAIRTYILLIQERDATPHCIYSTPLFLQHAALRCVLPLQQGKEWVRQASCTTHSVTLLTFSLAFLGLKLPQSCSRPEE